MGVTNDNELVYYDEDEMVDVVDALRNSLNGITANFNNPTEIFDAHFLQTGINKFTSNVKIFKVVFPTINKLILF